MTRKGECQGVRVRQETKANGKPSQVLDSTGLPELPVGPGVIMGTNL